LVVDLAGLDARTLESARTMTTTLERMRMLLQRKRRMTLLGERCGAKPDVRASNVGWSNLGKRVCSRRSTGRGESGHGKTLALSGVDSRAGAVDLTGM